MNSSKLYLGRYQLKQKTIEIRREANNFTLLSI